MEVRYWQEETYRCQCCGALRRRWRWDTGKAYLYRYDWDWDQPEMERFGWTLPMGVPA